MITVYLDIESLSAEIDSKNKVVCIGLLVEQSLSNNDKLIILKEWEEKEDKIIHKFFNCLNELIQEHKIVELVGFNILRFDIPLLELKGLQYDIKNPFEVFRECYTIDIRQVLLPLNQFRFKGLNLLSACKIVEDIFGVAITKPEYSNYDIPELYHKKDYDAIIRHLEGDLRSVRDLYRTLREHLRTLLMCQAED